MTGKFSRRDILRGLALGSSAIALAELGGLRPAYAEDNFIVASTGGGTGDGVRDAFIETPKLQSHFKTSISQSFQLDSVAASKVLAQPVDTPPSP